MLVSHPSLHFSSSKLSFFIIVVSLSLLAHLLLCLPWTNLLLLAFFFFFVIATVAWDTDLISELSLFFKSVKSIDRPVSLFSIQMSTSTRHKTTFWSDQPNQSVWFEFLNYAVTLIINFLLVQLKDLQCSLCKLKLHLDQLMLSLESLKLELEVNVESIRLFTYMLYDLSSSIYTTIHFLMKSCKISLSWTKQKQIISLFQNNHKNILIDTFSQTFSFLTLVRQQNIEKKRKRRIKQMKRIISQYITPCYERLNAIHLQNTF